MSNEQPPGPARRLIDGRSEWQAAVREALLTLPDSTAREITLADVDFELWPLGEPAVVDALTRWLRQPGRKLRLLAIDYDGMVRYAPRFVAWRRSWTHAIEAMAPADLVADDMPSMLWMPAPPLAVELLDRERGRARLMQDPREVRLVADRIAAILQRSEPAWPANALGL